MSEQGEFGLPIPGDNSRSSARFLPRFYRSEANLKFLQATLDQLIQPGVAEKINGYVGRKNAKGYRSTDNYLPDVSKSRQDYQLEPAVVIKDNLDNVTFYKDYNDYINQLNFFNVNTANHSKVNEQLSYPWNPNIDWDKFTNFREYYWLPDGPLSVSVQGQSKEVQSTFTVTVEEADGDFSYVFDGKLARNPTLRLYRGQRYRFEIDTENHPFAIAVTRSFEPGNAIVVAGTEGLRGDGLFDAELYGNNYDMGDWLILPSSGSVDFETDDNVSTFYPDGIRKLGIEGEEIANVYVEQGVIEFTIPLNAPDRLYYISQNNIDLSGEIRIYDIEENSFLNVENDILGKKTYTSANGVEFTNGLKVYFRGETAPEKYQEGYYYVAGVGSEIKLIDEDNLIIPQTYTDDVPINFDTDQFDRLPFDNAKDYPLVKDYITINRASQDGNAWTRSNRWFHKSVIEKSYSYSNISVDIDEEQRAKRPIIEFEEGLKLYNYGTASKKDIDLVDTFTQDVFSIIEGSLGYNIDGVDLVAGMRVLFTADTDRLVSGKIYEVKFVRIGNNDILTLVETEDSLPLENETVLVRQGTKNSGKTFFYDGSVWKVAQEKKSTNQPPLFDLCCPEGNLYSDPSIFDSSTFTGCKVFSYRQGSGKSDPELGFPLSYRNINNTGDIVFNFDLATDSFIVQQEDEILTVNTDIAYLRKYTRREDFKFVNGWSSTPVKTRQKVLRQYVVTDKLQNNFEVDVYANAGRLTDLRINVFLDNVLQVENQHYEIDRLNNRVFVRFYTTPKLDSVILLKCNSSADKNSNGWYDFPINLERNPLNQDIADFTLGEVINHVESMIEDIVDFKGVYPGPSNMRDLGDLDRFGKRFIKHSGPLNLPLYSITNKKYNIVRAIEYATVEYSNFKRNFLQVAETLGFDGETKTHVDRVLERINKDKIKTQPFYFSDMIGYKTTRRIEHEIFDPSNNFYSMSQNFDLGVLSSKSVTVYLNAIQLVFDRDYHFTDEGFINMTVNLQFGDKIEIYEYDSTDGSFIPPTPTKLGIYPRYEPEIVIDEQWQSWINIQPVESKKPYKMYGESEDTLNTFGWFYPLYIDRKTASLEDENSEVVRVKLKGLSRIFYAPRSKFTVSNFDNDNIDMYPQGEAFIVGHDGSLIKCYKDYRDQLILDLEKRIYNNIKIDYNKTLVNTHDYISGSFRNTGISKNDIDSILIKDFVRWNKIIDIDYTKNSFYSSSNQFTFNYSNSTSVVNGETLPGYWRGIYKEAFDTDRPHTHPWEMLGFTIKPKWWNTIYGPAPYTSNNTILWSDLEQGIVREPGKQISIKKQYIRPGLTRFIPADNQGQLKSPIASNYAKNSFFKNLNKQFKFGDHAPVETAWRRSSEYPFSVVRAILLNRPADFLSKAYDASRIIKNRAGQYVYFNNLKNLKLDELVFPNTVQDNNRIITSGLINFVYNLIGSNVVKVYEDFKNDLTSIQNQLGFKLGGFSDSEKINLLLESKSPAGSESSSVFIPQENYQIFLNTSSPVEFVTYSGVIIEKATDGYVIRGYDEDQPFFRYYEPVVSANDITISAGGIPSPSVTWRENSPYIKGQIILNDFQYYKVLNNFTSDAVFSNNNLAKLAELPIEGGKTAKLRNRVNKQIVNILNYGTKITNHQIIIDFLIGYQEYLIDKGYKFEYYDSESNTLEDFKQSSREFLYWTTQGWAAGTTLSLSPAAVQVEFRKDFVVVDDIYDDFYPYSLLDETGSALRRQFSSILRDRNSFSITVKNTQNGIYNIKLPLVQKEHVVLIDNKTIFDDVIYQPYSGFRQERIKVVGYRSDEWSGGLNIPGFVYDDAQIFEWEPWQDYRIGSLVKYKEFYYTALYNVAGSQDFEFKFWFRLNEKPESQLTTNFDYKINQFADFYDLDSEGFDEELQKMAQHLIGYQKRDYLANIIVDEVSQYKFYQGFIQEKGSRNSIDKLFNNLKQSSETLNFYEEWAVKTGEYGASDKLEQLDIPLKEDKMLESPQGIEILEYIPNDLFDSVFRIRPFELLDKPLEVNIDHILPIHSLNEYIGTRGYVHEDDVEYKTGSFTDLINSDVNLLNSGEYIWLTDKEYNDWTVYQILDLGIQVKEFSIDTVTDTSNLTATLVISNNDTYELVVNDNIAIRNAGLYNIFGFFKIVDLDFDSVTISISAENNFIDFVGEEFTVVILREVRVKNFEQFNQIAQNAKIRNQKVWVDDYDSNKNWSVLENQPVYSRIDNVINPNDISDSSDLPDIDQDFARDISITSDNKIVVVTSPNSGNGEVFVYKRNQDSNELNLIQTLNSPNFNFDNSEAQFGYSVSISDDGEFIAIGMPSASSIKTNYKGEFSELDTYNKGDVVKYKETLWKTVRKIFPRVDSTEYSTFDSYIQMEDRTTDESQIYLLSTGNPRMSNSTVDHFVLRAPIDMYQASKIGDKVRLIWNNRSTIYNNLTQEFFPFDNEIIELTDTKIDRFHTIGNKVDQILYIDVYTFVPQIDDTVQSRDFTAQVAYVFADGNNMVLYLKNQRGVLEDVEDIYIFNFATSELSLIGAYEKINYGFDEEFAGFWIIPTDAAYETGDDYFDEGKGLVYLDLIRSEDFNPITEIRNSFYNVLDSIDFSITNLRRNINPSIINNLSYQNNVQTILSNKWAVRMPKSLSDVIENNFISEGNSNNPKYNFYLYDRDESILTNSGLSFEILNRENTVNDVWDGYIDIVYTITEDVTGNFFEVLIGDIIEDAQRIPDAYGEISENPLITNNRAEVVYVKQFSGIDANKVRAYIKIISGVWQLQENVILTEVYRTRIGDTRRVIGEIVNYRNDVVVPHGNAGKFAIFQYSSSIPYGDNFEIIGKEYHFYTELFGIGGSPTPANYPGSLNRDYTQIYNIPTSITGTVGPENEGVVTIFRKSGASNYNFTEAVLISEKNFGIENNNFGKKIKLIKKGNGYRLYVASSGNQNEINPGVIEFFDHGPLENSTFRGSWSPNITYTQGDNVIHLGKYYVARTNIENQQNESILNTGLWLDISWRRSVDLNYKGIWNNSNDYSKGSIVLYENNQYVALTNVAPSNTNINDRLPSVDLNTWELLESNIEYSSFIPNVTTTTENQNLINVTSFVDDFRLSANGEVLVTKVTQIQSDSSFPVKFLVYRLTLEGRYILSQSIPATDNTSGFGIGFDISLDGNNLAISQPYKTNSQSLRGKVNVYKLVNEQFELEQVIEPPLNTLSKNFGYSVSFGKDSLNIASFAGIVLLSTVFDQDTTLFDEDETEFQKVNYDPGAVYVYEKINNIYVFAETVPYDSVTAEFRETLHTVDNHIYVCLPNKDNNLYRGSVYDFRKPKDVTTWQIIREAILPVDLDKIQGVFLYNKRTNQIITNLDYIDPIQGKIAGPADQNINYKVPYDPAFYNVGEFANDFYWEEEHVGTVWWDLSKARFTHPYQGDINYQKANWNELQPSASIDVYEWVGTSLLPSSWDAIADTEKGNELNVTGQTLYGNDQYSKKFIFDNASQTFREKYYYWVKNKRTIPNKEFRTISVFDVARLIAAPRQQGYRYVSLLSTNRIALNNCRSLIYNDDIVLAIRYSYDNITEQNSHSIYQLVTDGLRTSVPDSDIELKWFDSLIGFDVNNRPVPDPNLTVKQKYGVKIVPRQGMFINRYEALKQFIERVNIICSRQLIAENFETFRLFELDPVPGAMSRQYDLTVDTKDQLFLVGTKVKQAQLRPIIINGRFTGVEILDPGRGYKTPPTYKINGIGSDVLLDIQINNLGQITTVTVVRPGSQYADNTAIIVRPFSVLVKSDIDIANKWAIYSYDSFTKGWNRTKTQSFDVTRYWNYTDWYADTYSSLSKIDHYVDSTYDLAKLKDSIGDVIKVASIGSGGWVLYEKTSNNFTDDIANNYRIVGRQNGTITFNNGLYDSRYNKFGFDNKSFDNYFYDNDPRVELRIILETIKDYIFVDELKIEYNQLFISSLRYILSEQENVDWLFKTSFIKVSHLAGNLEQDLTFNIDNLDNFRSYIEEVKPYKTNIREFVSNYQRIEETNTTVTDFDVPVFYDSSTDKIVPINLKIESGVVVSDSNLINQYPRRHWLDNVGLSVREIYITDPGSEYIFQPKVEIVGNGTGAKAEAYVGYGKITSVVITDPGKGYTQTPTIVISPPPNSAGTQAKAYAVLGNSLAKSTKTAIKFDRNSVANLYSDLSETETFTGTNLKTDFVLKWPLEKSRSLVSITVDGKESLINEYNIDNVLDKSKSYRRYLGKISFVQPPANESVIVVNYQKSLSMLNAVDRIKFAYKPTDGMFGSDIAQLMDGVDYAGVEIKSFDFQGQTGWDTKGWFVDLWDEYENTFEDEIVYLDNSTNLIILSKPLEDGVTYNAYRVAYDSQGNIISNVRLDDPDFGTVNVRNLNATTTSIIGDGSTQSIMISDLGITSDVAVDEYRVAIVIRKITSDGSVKPNPTSYDLNLDGGNLNYANAKGVRAEEIIVDGDGFVTPTTSKSVEELVPGQVQDTLDIQVTTIGEDSAVVKYRIFKDILNRTIYKRIDNPATVLAKDLTQFSLSIEVEDGTKLPQPSRSQNIPGIVWIGKERIEYLVKEGNLLRQIRRGTLGTGVRDVHPAGTEVYDQSTSKNINYLDITQSQTATDVNSVELSFLPASVDEFEVFVNGIRLNKKPIQKFDSSINQDSPEADVLSPADFELEYYNNFANARISITNGSILDFEKKNITIVRKKGNLWHAIGESITEAQTSIGFFLRSRN